MAAVPVPLSQVCGHPNAVPLPPAPAAAPTLQDAEAAVQRCLEIELNHSEIPNLGALQMRVYAYDHFYFASLSCPGDGHCDADCLESARAYERQILEKRLPAVQQAGGAPPGVHAAIAVALRPVVRFIKRHVNSTRVGGVSHQWEVIFFLNGDDPTIAPHNLPGVLSHAAAMQLTNLQCQAYLAGYELPLGPNNNATRRDAVANFCRRL